ncbi:MAG: hypothetical protein BWX71_02801 [Deltaproteobacteria bacterium ADurb.Bin072]|jgi:hypothetical protein|nr:MAG: hypothetical protein BWX71_02801 [Deltaproteobacteria bacterium ADurb.Bin072]
MTELFTAIDAGQYDPWLTLFAALILLLCTE